MGYTPEQEKCILRLKGPVDVSAGAGSGKTFTLTQRISHALSDPASGIDDIDQVLAITFTKKAAAELKERVRSTLRSQGMFAQARKVDGAWISTIHSMCARILRASALEIGIDPGFSVMEDPSELLEKAIEEVLEESRQNSYQEYRQLFAAYPAATAAGSFAGESVTQLLNTLLEEVHALPDGFASMHFISVHDNVAHLLCRLAGTYEDSLSLMGQVKESATQASNVALCETALDALNPLIDGTYSGEVVPSDVLGSCARLDGRCGSKAQKERLKEIQATYDETVLRLLLCESDEVFAQLVRLARAVEDRFAAKKRQLAVLDNGDLIRQALKALENPQVKAQYENKFRLVMVDEFQDTDALQLAIVKALSGAGQRYLCTVGDAQQSIYRFRGADVALYRAYQREMFEKNVARAGGEPCALRLTRNFRSHGDILAFVKAVCAQQEVFGQGFLDLQAVYDGAEYRANDPRVFIDVTLRHKGRANAAGSKDDALQQQAARIAAYFARMKQAGHDLAHMVLLLGATTHADLYAQTLRRAGFDCVISGGSLFAQSEEAQHMVHLARALVNFKDTEALENVLMGPLFRLSPDDMLSLATTLDDVSGKAVKCSLDKGLARAFAENTSIIRQGDYAHGNVSEGCVFSSAVREAARLLYAARDSLCWQPLSKALLWLLRQSGCFARLEQTGAQGSACMGNYLKALRLMEEEEKQGGVGPSQVSAAYAQAIAAGIKEAPGALNVHEQQAIRIMTIHASKGLEFPIVALADFAKTPRSNNLLVARVQGATYATLFPKGFKIGSKTYGKSMEMQLVDEQEEASPAVLSGEDGMKAQVVLQRCALEDEAAEGQRLFYVGATRAKEALGIFMTAQEKDDPAAMYAGTQGDVARALFADGFIPAGVSHVNYGGSEPALIDCHYYEPEPVTEPDAAFDAAPEAVPAPDAARCVLPGEGAACGEDAAAVPAACAAAAQAPACPGAAPVVPFEPLVQLPAQKDRSDPRTGIYSYTSISESKLTREELEGVFAATDDDEVPLPRGLSLRLCGDDDKATDFGLALHRACQLSLETSGARVRNQLERLAKTYAVSQVERLKAAFERWEGSSACARVHNAARVFAEYPFAVNVGETPAVLEGVFDVLCLEEGGCADGGSTDSNLVDDGRVAGNSVDGKRAYVVDYKTGGHANETYPKLRQKHGLQAACYAYALLKEGFLSIDMDFVRVDQEDPQGEDSLQSVAFHFDASDFDQLQELIRARVCAAKDS